MKKSLLICALCAISAIGCKKTIVYNTALVESRLQQSGNDITLDFTHELIVEYTHLNGNPLNISFTSTNATIGQKATIILNDAPNAYRIVTTNNQRYENTGILGTNNIRRVIVTYLGDNTILVDGSL